jgi:hypothetical protein
VTPETIAVLQRGVGNAAFNRALGAARQAEAAEAEAVPVQRSLVHEVLSSPGQPLDASVRRDLEPRLGWDFSRVRVHDDERAARSADEVGAAAYTSGDHVVVGRGGMTRHLWAHELGHVIQQESGAVEGTDRGDGVSVSHPNDRFERMAEENASRALSTDAPVTAPTPAPAAPGAPQAGPAIQRAGARELMSPGEFQEQTPGGPRAISGVRRVDQALKRHSDIDWGHRDRSAERLAALQAIVRECRAYLDSGSHKGRRQGVERLRDQAGARADMLNSLPGPYPALPTGSGQAQDEARTARFQEVLAAMDRSILEYRDNEYAYDLTYKDLPGQAMRAANNLSDENFSALMRGYLEQLESLTSDPGLPEETRAMLNEVLAFKDRFDFAKVVVTRGMRADRPFGTGASDDRRYAFHVDTEARGGTSFLLGHMAHELTHISAHQAFDSTDVMLLLPIDSTDQQVAATAQRRKGVLADLASALEGEEHLFHSEQHGLLKEKVDYGGELGKVRRYADNLHRNGQLTGEEFEKLKRWDELAGDASGTLVEYDTVLNQMLVYLHLWKTPQESTFYRKLRAAAGEATAARQRAAAARRS